MRVRLLVAAMLVACSDDNADTAAPAGTLCDPDTVCRTGLDCLTLFVLVPIPNGPARCAAIRTSCSIPCRLHEDCAMLGSEFLCLQNCDGSQICVRD